MGWFEDYVKPYIRPGIGLGMSLFGGGQTDQQKSAQSLINNLVGQLSGTATAFSGIPQMALNKAVNFFGPLASGDRNAAVSVLAPDISRINEQFDSILQSSYGTRGGAGPSIYAAAPYEKQKQIQGLFQNLRPDAAKQLSSIGGQTLSSILSALGLGLGGGRQLTEIANTAFENSQAGGKSFVDNLLGVLDAESPNGKSILDHIGDVISGKGGGTQNPGTSSTDFSIGPLNIDLGLGNRNTGPEGSTGNTFPSSFAGPWQQGGGGNIREGAWPSGWGLSDVLAFLSGIDPNSIDTNDPYWRNVYQTSIFESLFGPGSTPGDINHPQHWQMPTPSLY